MSGKDRETPGVEAPGPIDRALDKDRDDRIDVLEGDRRQPTGASTTGAGRAEYIGGEGEIRVPVVEERLQVGKREVDLGEIEIRRRVIEEEQLVPVTLRREEVTVEQVDTPDRPLRSGEEAFQEGTIRVPVHGEEAVVAKEAVVTGEVVIEKEVETEQRTVSDTVRRTEVDFDEHYTRARGDFEAHHATTAGAQGVAFTEAEPHYRTGYQAGADTRFAGREFDEVEPDLQRQHGGGDSWARLREQVRTGFNRARGR